MNVDVVFVNYNPEAIARHYADQGLLETLLDRSLWRPPSALNLRIVEGFEDLQTEGAIVILPARHNATPERVERFKADLDKLAYSVVLLVGDEAWEFPWSEIPETETRRVWSMQPIPAHSHLSGKIPGGFYPRTDTELAKHGDRASNREWDWFFAGQVTHARRQQAAKVLRRLGGGMLHETDGYLRGMPMEEYFRQMAGAKVIPCPSGPIHLDTARTFEALEAGAVPVSDLVTGRGESFDYWTLLFGEGHPLLTITGWNEFPQILKRELELWPANSNRMFSFWQAQKRKWALQLDDDLRAVAGVSTEPKIPDDLITVVMSTSPIPSHPSIEHIQRTVNSIRAQLPLAEILIAVDGVRPEQEDRRADYEEFTRGLLWTANHEWSNVLPILMDDWVHQANATRELLKEVRTPLILFMEHDTPLVGEIPWPALCDFVESGEANLVRFHHETKILEEHKYLQLDHRPKEIPTEHGTIEGIRTTAFWARPHLASANWYEKMLDEYFPLDSRTFIEDKLYGLVRNDWTDHGEAGWDKWRLWIYTPEGNIKRSAHSDARGEEEKYELFFGTEPE